MRISNGLAAETDGLPIRNGLFTPQLTSERLSGNPHGGLRLKI